MRIGCIQNCVCAYILQVHFLHVFVDVQDDHYKTGLSKPIYFTDLVTSSRTFCSLLAYQYWNDLVELIIWVSEKRDKISLQRAVHIISLSNKRSFSNNLNPNVN